MRIRRRILSPVKPCIIKVTKFKNCDYFAKKRLKPISVFESKRVDKINSGTLCFCQRSFCQNDVFNFLRNWPFLS